MGDFEGHEIGHAVKDLCSKQRTWFLVTVIVLEYYIDYYNE